MFTAACSGNKLHIHVRAFARRGSHRKHGFPSIVASIRVYAAVAWQRVDQIPYIVLGFIDISGSFVMQLIKLCRAMLYVNPAKSCPLSFQVNFK
jgi:hypothetical protein